MNKGRAGGADAPLRPRPAQSEVLDVLIAGRASCLGTGGNAPTKGIPWPRCPDPWFRQFRQRATMRYNGPGRMPAAMKPPAPETRHGHGTAQARSTKVAAWSRCLHNPCTNSGPNWRFAQDLHMQKDCTGFCTNFPAGNCTQMQNNP